MHPMLNIAIRAARSAGDFIARSFESDVDIKAEKKGDNDYVTKIDREAEQIIINKIKQSYPEHSFVGEESGITEGSEDFKWVIDPIDGTTNFVMGVPHFCVSIALFYKGKLDQAVVFDPIRSELFTASKGKGAQMNNYRLRVNQSKELTGTLLGSGFPYKKKENSVEAIERFGKVYEKCGDIRCSGSAALDMAYVAAGRLDGYWEKGIKPWDIAAGELLVKEAGGLVTDFAGGHDHLKKEEAVAGNPKIVQSLVKILK
ncbi:inositol-1-monophosphatase [Paraneptunicella aestuarii]|uniref:inositol-1-monophosphatase n=1 Tax=Paraneptunicella aestuarii TaxID=2831148 RepID=UPI001E45C892|nr:inositol-1-monophosphatase [Paraneptunicella aestuarii]UAA39425.1 inositol-1-monophosphatase [Paraneptunicella aestuarii]